jgi:hypothetical protein
LFAIIGNETKARGLLYNLEGQLAIQGYDPVAYFKH